MKERKVVRINVKERVIFVYEMVVSGKCTYTR